MTNPTETPRGRWMRRTGLVGQTLGGICYGVLGVIKLVIFLGSGGAGSL